MQNLSFKKNLIMFLDSNSNQQTFKCFREDDIFDFKQKKLRRIIDLSSDFDCESQSETINSCIYDQVKTLLRTLG